MVRSVGVGVLGGLAAMSIAGASTAQVWADDTAALRPYDNDPFAFQADFAAQPAFDASTDRAFDGVFESRGFGASTPERFSAVRTNSVWRETSMGAIERIRVIEAGQLRGRGGAPLPLSPMDRGAFDPDYYEISYTRGWPGAAAPLGDNLQIEVTPHAGLTMSTHGGAAEAGATIRIGENLVRNGQEAFGDRGRWYLFAAGSGRAVGYNWARTADGDFARSGFTHDAGSFMGDAQIGVAWRRGDIQTSIGYVYREHEADEVRIARGLEREVAEGVLAFQLSIKPER